MGDIRTAAVIGNDGLRGELLDPLPARPTETDTGRVRLSDGRLISVPADLLTLSSDGTYLMPIGPEDVAAADAERTSDEGVVPVIAEQLVVGKRAVATGGVRVNRRVVEHDEVVETPLRREQVDVRRVVVDREVDGPLPVRKEGDVTIIPVVEEVLVVQKRYVLREEVHVSRIVREELHRERVTVRRQEAEIEQTDAQGNTVAVDTPADVSVPRTTPTPEPEVERTRRPRRSILGER